MALESPATVRDWIVERTPEAPETLRRRMFAVLGRDAEASADRTAEICLAAAARSLERIVCEQRFGREHALELLAIDALTTIAFEHASHALDGDADLATLATASASQLGQLSAQRV